MSASRRAVGGGADQPGERAVRGHRASWVARRRSVLQRYERGGRGALGGDRLDRLQLRGHREDGRPYGLQDVGRPAAAAGPAPAAGAQPDPGHPPLHAGPVQVTAALAHRGPQPLDRAGGPALGRLGVDAVQDQQMPEQFVLRQLLEQRLRRVVQHPGERLAVDLGQQPYRLQCRAGRALQPGQHLVEPGEPRLHRRVRQPYGVSHGPLRTSASARW